MGLRLFKAPLLVLRHLSQDSSRPGTRKTVWARRDTLFAIDGGRYSIEDPWQESSSATFEANSSQRSFETAMYGGSNVVERKSIFFFSADLDRADDLPRLAIGLWLFATA